MRIDARGWGFASAGIGGLSSMNLVRVMRSLPKEGERQKHVEVKGSDMQSIRSS